MVFDYAMVPMTSSAPRQFGNRMLRRLAPWTALVFSLWLTGCASTSLRGGSYFEDEWSTLPKSMRRADDPSAPTAYSNKARQIERNLGVD